MLICSFPPQFLKETPASKGDCFIAELLPAYSQTAISISKRQNSNFTNKKATFFFFQVTSCFLLHLFTCLPFPVSEGSFSKQQVSQGCTIAYFKELLFQCTCHLLLFYLTPTKLGVRRRTSF